MEPDATNMQQQMLCGWIPYSPNHTHRLHCCGSKVARGVLLNYMPAQMLNAWW